jgi:hypothetical protein
MHDALSHGQFEPLFLTDEEIALVADLRLSSIYKARHYGRLGQGEQRVLDKLTYSGKPIRTCKTFTPVDVVRTWLVTDNRADRLPHLDKLIADNRAATLSVVGE